MPVKTETSPDIRLSVREPKMYAVIMHNDDYTTMEFVVDVLMRIFSKSEAEATAVMLNVHKNGSSVVAVYTFDIAVTKQKQAVSLAADRGFPLKITVREAT